MLDIVATDLGVKRFFVVVERGNCRSLRLAERLGFSEASPQQATQRGVVATDMLLLKVLP
jgi:L-amino acid N-acyltransferase YncA